MTACFHHGSFPLSAVCWARELSERLSSSRNMNERKRLANKGPPEGTAPTRTRVGRPGVAESSLREPRVQSQRGALLYTIGLGKAMSSRDHYSDNLLMFYRCVYDSTQ